MRAGPNQVKSITDPCRFAIIYDVIEVIKHHPTIKLPMQRLNRSKPLAIFSGYNPSLALSAAHLNRFVLGRSIVF